jgi:hypothetical protein
MLVIQNRKVKKGIEIPEIEITIVDETYVFAPIDKVKYADFLNLNPHCFGVFYNAVENKKDFSSDFYVGDEVILSFPDYQCSDVAGIMINRIEI